MIDRLRSSASRVTSARYKLMWGVRTVGLGPTVAGSLRLLMLHLRSPERSAVRLRSGYSLGFAYPSQVPVTIIAFGDVIDPEYEFLRLVSRPDWVVVDVGAAIGQFTVFMARLPVRQVHAFEPSGANLESLRRNLGVNGVADKVTIHEVALSDYAGEAAFVTAGHTWVSGLSQAGGSSEELVAVRRLSDELSALQLDRVDVLKINVAGYEAEVLDGAMDILSKGSADLLILLLNLTCIPRYARLKDYGYRFFFFHPKRLELHEIDHLDESMLECRPWPARHLIGVHSSAVGRGVLRGLPIRTASAAR